LFEPGIASRVLCEDLGFLFMPDGSFNSEARNCIVIKMGRVEALILSNFRQVVNSWLIGFIENLKQEER